MSTQLSLFAHINDVTTVQVAPVEENSDKVGQQENWQKCATCKNGDFVGAETCGRVDIRDKNECWANDFKFYVGSGSAVVQNDNFAEKMESFYTCKWCGKNTGKLLVPNPHFNIINVDLVCNECLDRIKLLEAETREAA